MALLGNPEGAPVFVLHASADTSASSFSFDGDPVQLKKFRVIQAWGIMTAAGAASDTAQVQIDSNAITEAVDLSALADKDVFDFASLDDAYYDVARDGALKLVTASAAQCDVYLLCVRAS